jgi:DNA-binding ferritin-like protein
MQSERSRLTALLDELQAAERAGATALERWVAVSDEPYLRGGLRVVRGRDLDHAALAEARLVALGGTPSATIRDDLRALCELLAEPTVPGRTKLGMLVARYPNGVLKLFRELVARIEADGETQALLEMVSDDDRVNLGWLREVTERSPGDEQAGAGEPSRVVAFLDALRAAEDASADVFAAWAAASPAEGLRGGLVAIAARERRHATLLGERVVELGGQPVAALEAATRGAAVERFGASDVDDRAKLTRLLDHQPAHGMPPVALGSDDETRAMLELIDATEQATFGWLRAYRAGMADGDSGTAADTRLV